MNTIPIVKYKNITETIIEENLDEELGDLLNDIDVIEDYEQQ